MRFRSRMIEVVTAATFYGCAAYVCLVAAVHLAAGLHLLHVEHFTGVLHWRWSAVAFAAMIVAYLAWFRTLQPDLSSAASKGAPTPSPAIPEAPSSLSSQRP